MFLYLSLLLAWTWNPEGVDFPKVHRFSALTIDEGLSQSSVYAVLQDHQGFIWLGTADGLNRYDGSSIKVYRYDPDAEISIGDNFVRDLCETDDGSLWVATRGGGLTRLSPDRQKAQSFRHDPEDASTLARDAILSLAETPTGQLWVGLDNGGISIFDWETETFFHVPKLGNNRFGSSVFSMVFDQQGNLWVGSNTGLFRLAADKVDPELAIGSFEILNQGNFAALDGVSVRALMVDRQQHLWIGTQADGLFRLDLKDAEAELENLDLNQEQGVRRIRSILDDQNGNVWVATDGMGLLQFDLEKNKLGRVDWRMRNGMDIDVAEVFSLYRDRAGVIWAGTFRDGVFRTDLRQTSFGLVIPDSIAEAPISDAFTKAFLEDNQGRLWVGTNKGITRLQRDSEGVYGATYFTAEGPDDQRLSHDYIRTLLQDQDGDVWVGTWGGGVCRIDRDDQISRIPFGEVSRETPIASLSHGFIRRMVYDDKDNLWIGTSRGLNRYLPESNLFQQYHFDDPEERFFATNRIANILPTKDGRLWLGTNGGLLRFDPDTGIFENFLHDPNMPESLSSDRIRPLVEDTQGRLWIGTDGGGLNLMVSQDPPRFKRFTTKQGLGNDVVYEILLDDEGYLWLSTNIGLSRFDPAAEHFKNYRIEHGLQSAEFNLGAAMKGRNGRLYFGGVRGFNAFLPEQLKPNPISPLVAITRVRVNYETITPQLEDGDLPLVTLRHPRQSIAFDFAALDYSAPSLNRYKFRMDGFKDSWTELDNTSSLMFSNLPAGNYRLQVHGANLDNYWSEKPAELRVRVIPSPWLSPWAFLIYCLTIVLVIVAFIYNQAKRLQRERRISERLREVDRMRDDFMGKISHELHTPIHGMVGIAESLLEGVAGHISERAQSNLSAIVSSGLRLITLVNDLKDFSRLKSHQFQLDIKMVELRPLTQVVLTLCKPLAGTKDLNLINALPPKLPLVHADETRLQQILYNLVGNAIKHTDQGYVEVSAAVQKGVVMVSVMDSGKGYTAEQFNKNFEFFESGAMDQVTENESGTLGIGLSITRQLVLLHGGELKVEANSGRGSKFTFSLPIAEEEAAEKQRFRVRDAKRPSVQLDAYKTLPPDAKDSEQLRVLIIDDELETLQQLKSLLAVRHFRVFTATSGPEALKLLKREEHMDLILLDLLMPRMSGYEVCRELRKHFTAEQLPVLMMTARDHDSQLQEALRIGANDFVTKPISNSQLMIRISTHLELREKTKMLVEMRDGLRRIRSSMGAIGFSDNWFMRLLDYLKRMVAAPDIQTLADVLLRAGRALFNKSDRIMFLIADPSESKFTVLRHTGFPKSEVPPRKYTLEELEGICFESRNQFNQGVYVMRLGGVRTTEHPMGGIQPAHSAMVLVFGKDDVIDGFLILESITENNPFTVADVRQMRHLHEHVLAVLERTRNATRLDGDTTSKGVRISEQPGRRIETKTLAMLGKALTERLQNPLAFIEKHASMIRGSVSEIEMLLRATAGIGKKGDSFAYLVDSVNQNLEFLLKNRDVAEQLVRRLPGIYQEIDRETIEVDFNEWVEQYCDLIFLGWHGLNLGASRMLLQKQFDPKLSGMQVLPGAFGRVLTGVLAGCFDLASQQGKNREDITLNIRTRDALGEIQVILSMEHIELSEELRTATYNPVLADSLAPELRVWPVMRNLMVNELRGRLDLERDYNGFVVTLGLGL